MCTRELINVVSRRRRTESNSCQTFLGPAVSIREPEERPRVGEEGEVLRVGTGAKIFARSGWVIIRLTKLLEVFLRLFFGRGGFAEILPMVSPSPEKPMPGPPMPAIPAEGPVVPGGKPPVKLEAGASMP